MSAKLSKKTQKTKLAKHQDQGPTINFKVKIISPLREMK